jgi:A/G-specific adenine glycosylase
MARAFHPVPAASAETLLDWYDRHRRSLPWRALPGETPDAYAVWLSEIMLQQTTVATVGPYFRDFMTRWPSIRDLAAASLDQVLHAWQGLGYYSRARNLHACARVVVERHDGVLPDTESALRLLPGIGVYTAAAIASIAFGRPATVMDGNVERVMARLFRIETPLPDAKPELYALAGALTPIDRPGDYAQGVMDLGATICTPRQPRCVLCPWMAPCQARQAGVAETLPRKRAKAPRPTRHAVAFWITRPDGAVLLRRRAESGLLGGLMEFPSTAWREGAAWQSEAALAEAPVPLSRPRALPGLVVHVFTHFRLEIAVIAAESPGPDGAGIWVAPKDFADHALPTVMKKVARHTLSALRP